MAWIFSRLLPKRIHVKRRRRSAKEAGLFALPARGLESKVGPSFEAIQG